ncbi:tetratricopeptide repeat-containing sensor histidine kinase [Taibaiella helva]|uniref:tetratricopeptide repeat-containing sensor histidine kinase n=1 Tax=Taibaiella helva TaxID=2301235 RepID=UPI000E576E81|nr:tetratricopeptide repeat-containing sensor histidine kinase [Taibaiella helva]
MINTRILKLLCFILLVMPVAGLAQPKELPVIGNNAESRLKGGIESGKELIQDGQYDSAIVLFRNLLPLCKGLNDETRIVSLINNYIGSTYIFKGNFDHAVQYLSLAASRLIDSPAVHSMLLIRIYNNLSVALNRISENESALHYLDKAEAIATQHGLVKMLPGILINQGRIYKEMQLWVKSKDRFDQVLLLLDTVTIESNLLGISALEIKQISYTNLGQLYIAQNNMQTALYYLQKSSKLLSSRSNPYYQVPNLVGLGRVYLSLKKYKLAGRYLEDALALSQKSGIGDGLSEAAHYLSDLYAATGNYERAYRFHFEYKKMEDSIRQNEKASEIRQLETRYRIVEKDKKLAESRFLRTQQERLLKNRNLWILLISVIALLVSIILVVMFRSYGQKQKIQQQHVHTLEKDKQIAVMKAMLEGEEKERGRIAGNLHDGIGSIISAVKMNFSILKLAHFENRDIYNKGMVLLDEAAKEIRATAHNLMPEILVQEGLEAAVRNFCKRMEQSRLLQIECQMNGDFGKIEKDMALLVYRIVQELVSNIVKHAMAAKALVQINYSDGLLMIAVEDNGRGIPGKEDAGGMGLRSIREKVSMLNGLMSVESTAAEGTQVYIEIDC